MKYLLYEMTLVDKNPIGISNGRHWIKECSAKEADEVIRKYHYSKKNTTNRFLSFRVDNNQGYLQLGYGIRPAKKNTVHPYIQKGNYAEFDRMWLSDELEKNSESQVISLLLSYLKQVYPHIKFIITYADESVGNYGTIYKATNARECEGVPVDFYVLPNGERVHPVTMWHWHKTRAWDFLQKKYPGIKHIKGDYQQRRFLYILDKKYKQ